MIIDEMIESYERQDYSAKNYMASHKPLWQDVQMLLRNLWMLEQRIIAKYGIHWRSK